VRLPACAACVLTVLTLAACGGNGDEAVWDGPPDPSADGTVAVDGFDEYTADVEETWEGSAAMAATEFLRLDERTATTTTIEASASGEGEGPQTTRSAPCVGRSSSCRRTTSTG
jgi:hypothetical protein